MSSLPTYLERGLRAEKDDIDQYLDEYEKALERVEMEKNVREQTRNELLISKFAELCIEFNQEKGEEGN